MKRLMLWILILVLLGRNALAALETNSFFDDAANAGGFASFAWDGEYFYWLHGKNELSTYLCDNTIEAAESYAKGKPWTRVIWDISTIVWLLDEKCEMMKEKKAPLSMPQYNMEHSISDENDDICYVWHIDRDKVFEDLFRRLTDR